MKATIVIPSYWGRAADEPFNPADDVYDHPTPIDGEGTLSRALESLKDLEHRDFNVVVIGVATNESLRERCRERLEEIVAAFSNHLSVSLFSYAEVTEVRQALTARGLGELAPLVAIGSYSDVRNACSLAAALAGSEVAVFVDDDEVVTDPRFMNKALESIGKSGGAQRMLGIAGFYERPESDGYLAPQPTDAFSAVWDVPSRMNEAFAIIGEEPRLKVTPFVFGGNMVVHRDLFTKIAFDPNVPRGEDIDFLINAKMFGFDFYLDNELYIKHLPPPKSAPKWRRFEEDVRRFVYTQKKLRSQRPVSGMRKVSIEELHPYPGAFLGDDLPDKIFKASTLMAMDYLARKDMAGYEKSLNNLAVGAFDVEAPEGTAFDWYLGYREKWERLMESVAASSITLA
ncbi:MAG: hypothetical protein ACE5E0_05505 [Terriglobia bacterium]